MKIVMATDFHLGYSPYGNDERGEDFYKQYDMLIRRTIQEDADVFIELGDIFDKAKPYPLAMKRFKDGLELLKANGIRSYGIIGNHTMMHRKDYYPIDFLFDDITILDDDYVVLDNVWFGGITYKSKTKKKAMKMAVDELYESAKQYDVKVLLLHNSLEDIGIGFDFTFEELELDRFDFVVLGHIHNRKVVDYNNTIVYYIGSLNSCNINELTDEMEMGRGYVVFDTETLEFEFKPLPIIRHYFEYTLTDDEFNEDFIEKTIKSLEMCQNKPMLQLNIESSDAKGIYEKVGSFNDCCLTVRHKLLQTKEEKKLIQQEFPNGKLPPVEVMIKKALDEKYEDEWVGDFAVELMKRLSSGNKKGAMELTDEMYNENFKKGDAI